MTSPTPAQANAGLPLGPTLGALFLMVVGITGGAVAYVFAMTKSLGGVHGSAWLGLAILLSGACVTWSIVMFAHIRASLARRKPEAAAKKRDSAIGREIVRDALATFRSMPILGAPLFLAWVYQAAVGTYFRFFFDWHKLDRNSALLLSFALIWSFALVLTFASAFVLEIMQPIRRGQPIDVMRAIRETLGRDLVALLLISAVWAVIWFVLAVIQAIWASLTKGRNSHTPDLSAKDVALYLSGQSTRWTSVDVVIELFQKLVRMVVFLTLPAVCWEDASALDAFKVARRVLREHARAFGVSYVLTGLAAAVVALPLSIFGFLAGKMDIQFPPVVWYAVMLYTGLAFTFTLYIEQLAMAELYLVAVEGAESDSRAMFARALIQGGDDEPIAASTSTQRSALNR